MKRAIQIGSICTILVVAVAGSTWAAVIEKPVVMPDAMVSVTISDLHGLIDGVGSVAAPVSPMANGMMLKNILGMQLNDPGLAGIAPGKGLAVVAMDPTNIFAVVEVSEAQAANYSAALSRNGVVSKFANGVLIIGQNAAQLEKGAGAADAVKSTLLARRSPTLRISARPAELYQKNKAQVDGMMQMMPMMMGMGMQQTPGVDPATIQNTTKILEGELRVLLSLAQQCESTEIVVAPQNGSFRMSQTFAALPGSRLAAMINAPKVNTTNPKVQAGMLGDAAIALDCSLDNPDALSTFLEAEVNALVKEMGLDSELISKVNQNMKKWIDIYSGSFSETISYGGENFIDVNCVVAVKDEAAAMELFKNMEQDMGPFLELYKSMGMPMTMESKDGVREHNGVKIHQFKIGVEMPAEQQAALQGMDMDLSNMTYEYAICDNLLLCAMGGTRIETLIDRARDAAFKAEPLQARRVYPEGGEYYCDIDLAEYMSGLSSLMPDEPGNPLPQLAVLLQGSDPVTSAGFREDGMVMWSVNVPGSLLAKIGQAVMMMQMQQQQQMEPGAMPAQ